MQDDISGWNEWNDAFKGIEELASPSELHGILTGIVCVTKAPTKAQWVTILDTLKIPALEDDALQLLSDEAEDIAAAIHDDELDYLPILPDDQHSLTERVYALADWCQGVVLGFGLASGHLRKDEAEWIEHLQDVANVDFSDEQDDEDNEDSYEELYEFVRLIPVNLATGRKKVEVADTGLLKHVNTMQPKLSAQPLNPNLGLDDQSLKQSSDIVEMFTPERPS